MTKGGAGPPRHGGRSFLHGGGKRASRTHPWPLPFREGMTRSTFDPLRTFAIERTLVGMLRAAAPILCMLALSGCSYTYDVQARVADGRLFFNANPQWGADCVRRVEVTAESDDSLSGKGVIWEQSISHDDACENRFPIAYGKPLSGRPRIYDSGGVPNALAGTSGSSVVAKKLRTGVIYTVSTTTGATGYGCGRFLIRSNRQVQHLGCS